MEVRLNKLHCECCGRIDDYIDGIFDEIKSQETQYNYLGKITFGKTHSKTDEDKIQAISIEYEAKIGKHLEGQLPPRVIRRASSLMYKIVKEDGNGKKKSNRDQLFAACLHMIVVQDMGVYSTGDLVKMFKLDKFGIGNGKGHINKYIMRQLALGVDAASILDIPLGAEDKPIDPLSINVDISPRLFSKHLTSLKIVFVNGEAKHINEPRNIKFCEEMLKFVNDNSIAYNTNLETKCIGIIYYLLMKRQLAQTLKKSSIAAMMGVYQSKMMGVFNSLCCPVVQELLPEEKRI
jgi:hypothetical protein